MRRRCTLWIVGLAVCGSALCMARASQARRRDLDLLLDAIATAESQNNAKAVGDGGQAFGPYQIHRAYWSDGTRFLRVDWGYEDARDPLKAREVVRAYLLHYGEGKGLIDLARIHNGGPQGDCKASTLPYARKIARLIDENTACCSTPR
jgi:hypothetical protein